MTAASDLVGSAEAVWVSSVGASGLCSVFGRLTDVGPATATIEIDRETGAAPSRGCSVVVTLVERRSEQWLGRVMSADDGHIVIDTSEQSAEARREPATVDSTHGGTYR